MTSFDVPVLGDSPCPECGRPAFFAWDDDMNVISLSREVGGSFTVTLDGNRLPWCAPVPAGTQIAFDDVLYDLHACPLAQVIPLTDRRRRDRPETRQRYA
jgi:hypothetical protein